MKLSVLTSGGVRISQDWGFIWMWSVLRGKDPLPRGPGSAEVCAGLRGEAQVLPGSLRDDGGPPSNTAAVHARKLLGAGGVFRTACCNLLWSLSAASAPFFFDFALLWLQYQLS